MWAGNEMEGPKSGSYTLFVEEAEIDIKTILPVVKEIATGKYVNVYLGAGRVDITKMDETALEILLDWCSYMGVKVSCEFTNFLRCFNNKIICMLQSAKVSLIYRMDVGYIPFMDAASMLNNLLIKIDDGQQVIMSPFTSKYNTSLETLKDGLYAGVDKQIYPKKEEK
jgi:hypothetical protein